MAKRAVPKRLARKLLAIRTSAGLSQAEFVKALKHRATPLRASQISNFEQGKREPNLMQLLAYARFADVPVERLIDDKLDLP